MTTTTEQTGHSTQTAAKAAALARKVALMSDAQKEARVAALYARGKLTDDEAFEFGAIALGGL